MFDLEFFLADAIGLIPVNFSLTIRTIRQFDQCYTLQFAPAPLSIHFAQSRNLSDAMTNRNHLDL
jgi:hypothetical protein